VLGPSERQQVRRFFDQVHLEMEDMLERTSGLLSDLTSCAAVVVGPSHEQAAIRSVQLVGLSPRLALLVVVLADGAVEKRSVELAEDSGAELLAAASAALAREVVGHLLSGAANFAPSGDQQLDRVLAAAGAALTEMAMGEENDQVFVGGPSGWRSPSTPLRRSARCCPSWNSSSWSSPCCATSSIAASRSPSGPSTASSPWRRARSSWRPSRSTASRRGPLGCSGRRA